MTYEEFIAKFPKTTKTSRGVLVQCPAHEDSPAGPSLSVGKSNDGGVLLKCFAGCSSESVVSSMGLSMRDLFASKDSAPRSSATFREAEPNPPTAVKPVIDKIYSYQDETGREVYQAIRLIPKSFRQRHKVGDAWVWTMDGVIRVLYRLPKILSAQTVWVCEGEKDADSLAAIGFNSTCNVGGAGKWLDGYTQHLAGKNVVICGDNDEAGKKHVSLVFDSIAGSAKTVKIINLPESVKDASEFIGTFKSCREAKDALDALEREAHPHLNGVSLPIYTVSEMEQDYKMFVKNMENNSFSLGKWIPSLSNVRPLVPGELVFIIGDTGTGKTGLLQQIAKAALPLPTLMFELELPRELMFERFASMAAKMTGREVEQAYRDSDSPENTLTDLLDLRLKNLFICTESKLTIEKIESYIMRSELKIGERPKVVLIDYIQLISGSGVNRREKVSDIAESLKILAKATRTIIIVTSQVARNIESPEPHLHSAKESGSIESSCGLLLGAWRDDKDPSLLNIRVLKSTKGGAGLKIECNFDGARMIITERSKIQNP